MERAPDTAALRAHRLHLLAARSWRARGRHVPPDLRADERLAAIMALAVPSLVARVRAAYNGSLMLMKGPEAAAHRQDPETRYFRDLDFLVDDPYAAQRALVASGFIEGRNPEDYEDMHHLRPLVWPGLPLAVELHRRPNCPRWLTPPPTRELFRGAVPSRTGVDGVLAPSPAIHALLLAAHSWAHRPLARLADLIDVLAVLDGDRNVAHELAERWGWGGMWRATIAAADAILANGSCPLSVRTWARHLQRARESTVLEYHLVQVAAPVCAMPLSHAPRALCIGFSQAAAKHPNESWRDKCRRSGKGLATRSRPNPHISAPCKGVMNDAATAYQRT